MEREIGEKFWRAAEMAEDDDGTVREWTCELVQVTGYFYGSPDIESVEYLDAIFQNEKTAECKARELNRRDGLR